MVDRYGELFETVTDPAVTVDAEPGAALPQLIAVESARFRSALMDSRSTVFLRLFDYLMARSGDPRAPKEIEIAVAVFDKEGAFDTAQNSIVRVHVHRLRKRLDDFYANRSGARLSIPNGEYRIVLSQSPASAPVGKVPSEKALNRDVGWPPSALLGLFAVLIAVPWIVALWWPGEHRHGDLARTPFWRPIAAHSQAPLIVAGDYYLFAETENRKDIKRLIMQPTIRSRRDLDGYFVGHPDTFYRYYDLDIHGIPAKTAASVWSVLSLVAGLHPEGAPRASVTVSSRLSDQQMRSQDLVFVGRLDALGPLSNLLVHMSRFRLGGSGHLMTDMATGKVYAAAPDLAKARDPDPDQAYGSDHGYVASFPGPAGNRILIIAGLGDAGVARMADLVGNRSLLDEIARRSGDASAFEALFEVRMRGNMHVGTALLVARPLASPRSAHGGFGSTLPTDH